MLVCMVYICLDVAVGLIVLMGLISLFWNDAC